MSADKQLKAYIDRVLRLKEEQDTIGDDIREVYAEAKNEGYDKTVMGKLVAHLRKVAKSGEDAVSEQADIFDTYLTAYHRASGTAVATHTHEENYDRETGEVLDTNPRLIKQVVDGMQTEAGRAALVAAVDIMIEREEAEHPASHGEKTVRPEPAASFVEEIAATIQPETATSSPSEDDAVAEVKGRARLANVVDVEPSSSAPIAPASHGEAEAPSVERVSPQADEATTGSADANTGGGHVDVQDFAATHQAGPDLVSETRPATIQKKASDYRPNCIRPEACGASGLDHCYSCRKLMQAGEAA